MLKQFSFPNYCQNGQLPHYFIEFARGLHFISMGRTEFHSVFFFFQHINIAMKD